MSADDWLYVTEDREHSPGRFVVLHLMGDGASEDEIQRMASRAPFFETVEQAVLEAHRICHRSEYPIEYGVRVDGRLL